jgi:allantoinase
MPLNSIPPTVDTSALIEKRAAARGKTAVDIAFWGGLIPGSEGELAALVGEGVCGFKSFLVDSGVPEFPPMTAKGLAAALHDFADLGVPALIHAEDPAGIHEPVGDPRRYATYLATRPAGGEAAAVRTVGHMTETSRARTHILHISSGEATDALAAGPTGMSGETCPHYLTFCAEEVELGSTSFKCAPPIRAAEHREALWNGLINGTLSMVVSDHSPAPAAFKAMGDGDFGRAWGGIGSLQLRLQATWTGAEQRGIELPRLAGWLATEPARLAGLDDRKGAIVEGMDADFVVWDPEGITDVVGARLEHRHPVTPYEGMRLRGRVVTTLLRGETVYHDGVVSPGRGRMMRRQ